MSLSSQPPPPSSSLGSLCESLKPPVEFNRYENADAETHARLEKWKNGSVARLRELRDLIRQHVGGEPSLGSSGQDNGAGFSLDESVAIIAATTPFAVDLVQLNNEIGGGERYVEETNVLRSLLCVWILPESQEIAQDILDLLFPSTSTSQSPTSPPQPHVPQQTLHHLLSHTIKPIFKASNPHPHLNLQTGKSLPPSQVGRPPQQGGFASVTQDFYESEGQKWKGWVGLGGVLYWCVSSLEASTYEDVWHLVIPPLMTFLDDYQPPYKLWGLYIVRAMLQRVPSTLLRKTGIDGLIRSSFGKALAHQDSEIAPPILRLAISQSLKLILLTTQRGSKDRFDALCTLVGENIISDIWTYAFDKPEVVRATLDALPDVVRELDVGCTRFLKMFIPQLTQPLLLPSQSPPIPGLPPIDPLHLTIQLSSLKLLIPLINVCAPRMYNWRLTILNALVRCWVAVTIDRAKLLDKVSPDSEHPEKKGRGGRPPGIDEGLEELKALLPEACRDLVSACPSLKESELPAVVAAEENLKGLVFLVPLE